MLVFSCAGPASADPAEEWAAANLRVRAPESGALRLDWTVVNQPYESRAELESRFDEVRDLPDHPDRWATLNKLRMLNEPSPLAHSYVRRDANTWYYSFEMAAGGALVTELGGNRSTRWMLFRGPAQGQLTVVPAGKPFPTTADMTRFLPEAETARRLFLRGGIVGAEVRLLESTPSAEGWVGLFESDAGVYRVTGVWHVETDEAVVSTTEVLSGDEVTSRFDFGGHAYSEALGRTIPSQATVMDSYIDHVAYYDLIDVEFSSDADLRARIALPDAGEFQARGANFAVVDYGDPDDRTMHDLSRTPTTSWRPDAGRAQGGGGMDGLRVGDDSPGGGASRVFSGGFIAAALVVLVGAVIVVFRVRRGN